MKKILLLLLSTIKIFAALSIEELTWGHGDTLLNFLQKNSIPISLYYELDKQDQELASEIAYRVKYQILKDANNNIEQVLIPISDDLQIHIYKDRNDEYVLSFSPISYQTEHRILHLKIKNSAYQDVYEQSGSSTLARAMVRAFGKSIDFRNIQKDDELILYYEQKIRSGKLWGDINIKTAMIQLNKKTQEVFSYNNIFYDGNGKEIESFLLTEPLKYTRITSGFSTARYHPILKRYRAHLGIDYAAPTGTPVRSAGKGVISFIGTRGGYGKVVQIKHDLGYMTLYAHLSRFAKIKKGQRVNQGQLIAYVGSTGMSTGPHLHFGVYLNNRAINPNSVVKIAKSELKGKAKVDFENTIAGYKQLINEFLANKGANPPREEEFENYIQF